MAGRAAPRRADKPRDTHPRTPLATKFMAGEEGWAWKFAELRVQPEREEDVSAPNAVRDERGRLRREYLPAWHLRQERVDPYKNIAARKLQAAWRGFITRKRMIVDRSTMTTVEMRYLGRTVQLREQDRKHRAAAEAARRAAEAAARHDPSVDELRAGRPKCMTSQVELGTLTCSAMLNYSTAGGGGGRSITQNSGGFEESTTAYNPRPSSRLGPRRPDSAPLISGALAACGARPSTAGATPGLLPTHKRRRRRRTRPARPGTAPSAKTFSGAGISEARAKQMRFDRLVTPSKHSRHPVGYFSEQKRAAEQNPLKIGKNNLMALFMAADADQSGELDADELRTVLINLNLGLDDVGLDKLIEDVDKDGDGSFVYREFVPMMQTKLMELSMRDQPPADFTVAACNVTQPIADPQPVVSTRLEQRWPPPLQMWLAELGMSQNEGAFRHRGYNSVDDLLRHKAMDGKELKLCGVVRRLERTKVLESLDVMRERWKAQGGRPSGATVAAVPTTKLQRGRLWHNDLWRAG